MQIWKIYVKTNMMMIMKVADRRSVVGYGVYNYDNTEWLNAVEYCQGGVVSLLWFSCCWI